MAYEEIRLLESFEEGQQTIRKAHSVAASIILALLAKRQTGSTRLGAAKDIQDRNEGKAVQQVEVRDGSEIEAMKQKLKGLFDDDENTTKNAGKSRKTRKSKSKGKKTAKPV